MSILLNADVSASNLTGLRRLYKYESSVILLIPFTYSTDRTAVYVSSPYLPEAVYPISISV